MGFVANRDVRLWWGRFAKRPYGVWDRRGRPFDGLRVSGGRERGHGNGWAGRGGPSTWVLWLNGMSGCGRGASRSAPTGVGTGAALRGGERPFDGLRVSGNDGFARLPPAREPRKPGTGFHSGGFRGKPGQTHRSAPTIGRTHGLNICRGGGASRSAPTGGWDRRGRPCDGLRVSGPSTGSG